MFKLPVLVISTILLLLSVRSAFAAGLSLTYIGTLATNGAKYSHWWYTVANPTLKGTATPSAAVTVTIDGVVNTITADSTGIWTLAPTILTTGDHQISLSSGGETQVFTLTIGSSMPSQSSGSGTPSTASTLPLVLVSLPSLLAILGGYRFLKS